MAKDEKNKKNNNPKNSFLKDSKAELKKVNWPTPKRLANDTATVIGIVLIVALIVFILDLAFLTLNENLIIKSEEKIKEKASNSIVVEDTDTDTTTDTENNEENENTETTEDTENESETVINVDDTIEETENEVENAE